MKRTIWLVLGLLAFFGCNRPEGGQAPLADSVADVSGDTGAADTDLSTDDSVADAEVPLEVPADRPILLYNGTTAIEHNAKLEPAGFTGPNETQCADDPTRQYIAEIVTNGIGDIQVDYHWAPVVSGPDPTRPTLDQPEWSLAGTLRRAEDSDDDVLGDHPFGLDFVFDVVLDAPFTFMSYPDDDGEHSLHCEIEQGTFPRSAFDYWPKAGDRTLLRGVWVFDCGHPPYEAELHPPTFLAFARALDAKTTLSLTFVAPYRSSLLFNPSTELTTQFDNLDRFSDSSTQPFSQALVSSVYRAIGGKIDRLQAHALMVANRFEPIDYLVCAPLPRPTGATLAASWRFSARTGVELRVEADDESGCVRVRAAMNDSYTPMPLPYKSTDWPWEELSKSASGQLSNPIDVLAEIRKIVSSLGINPDNIAAFTADHPPIIDAYDALQPSDGADLDTPTEIRLQADDQPFPFYGRVRAAWK
ncbi:MAG: hypothetical protein KC609_15315 [Myxococcales bacterium]|nr:hypothetical protein [Myxococcales bacterium]